MEDRSWAKGMTQEQFNLEWAQRYPQIDVTPDVHMWCNPLSTENTTMERKDMWIDKFNTEDLVVDDPVKDKELQSADQKFKNDINGWKTAVYECVHCKKRIKSRIGVISHERKCTKNLNNRLTVRELSNGNKKNVSTAN